MGSITINATSPISLASQPSRSMSAVRLKGLSTKVPSMFGSRTASRISTCFRSAPAALKRGRIVSSGTSSAERMITFPFSHCVPSTGQTPPIVTTAAMLAVTWLFPRSGCPASIVTFPRAIRPSHSQW